MIIFGVYFFDPIKYDFEKDSTVRLHKSPPRIVYIRGSYSRSSRIMSTGWVYFPANKDIARFPTGPFV